MNSFLNLKIYLNEEIGRLKGALLELKAEESIANDESIKEKLQEIHQILEESGDREIDTSLLELVLNTQSLLEEIKNHDD